MRPDLRKIKVIQGGMGFLISGERLAIATASYSDEVLGVVSLTASAIRLVGILKKGGPDAARCRDIIMELPREVHEYILDRFYFPDGTNRRISMPLPWGADKNYVRLTVAASYYMGRVIREAVPPEARVGYNLLEKIQNTHPAEVYGATLAGLDTLLMGAGLPMEMARMLRQLEAGEVLTYPVPIKGVPPEHLKDVREGKVFEVSFDPEEFGFERRPLQKPDFIAIVSSAFAAKVIFDEKRGVGPGGVQGLVVERPIAGGHNANPRKDLGLNEWGEPKYGELDNPEIEEMTKYGVPVWMAGGYASPEGLAEVLSRGGTGIQAGTIFAMSEDSGELPGIRRTLIRKAYERTLVVRTTHDSPTGYAFKGAQLPDTTADPETYASRPRNCSERILKVPEWKKGRIAWTCPSEPVEDYIRDRDDVDAAIKETEGKRCICNGLKAATDEDCHQGNGYKEPPYVTLGDDTSFITHLVSSPDGTYTAHDALDYLFGKKA